MVGSVLCKYAIVISSIVQEKVLHDISADIFLLTLLLFLYVYTNFLMVLAAFMTLHIIPSLAPFLPLVTFARTFAIWISRPMLPFSRNLNT